MPRAPKVAKLRLNLQLSGEARRRLEALRDKTEADSLADVIRRALAVYDLVWAEKLAGSKLLLRDAEGVDREVFVV